MFEYGEKLICTDDSHSSLTFGKKYTCLGEAFGFPVVTDDAGETSVYDAKRFKKENDTEMTRTLPPFPFKIATASAMPGTNGGFTMVCFDGKEIPEGTKVYIFKE